MVRMTYVGLADPVGEFEALRPLVIRLGDLQRRCKPFGRDHHVLAVAMEGVDAAAYHFTRRPQFYAEDDRHS
jgi:hypothetical protein